MKVNDYVYVTNIIPKEFCETIIDVIKNRDWKKIIVKFQNFKNVLTFSKENIKEILRFS